jgi:hypothetical protein
VLGDDSCFEASQDQTPARGLQRRLDTRSVDAPCPEVMRDLTELRGVEVTLDEQRYRLRTELKGLASVASPPPNVRPPSIVTPLA